MEYGNDELNKLKNIGLQIIKEEGLLSDNSNIYIKFKHSVSGVRKRWGVCRKCITDYYIIVNTIKAKWFIDENGKFKDKKGIKYRRAALGEKISFEQVRDTLAHEIAHLKFWRHDAQHKSYTQYIDNKIQEKWVMQNV